MRLSSSSLSSHLESSSSVENNTMKRLFSKTDNDYMDDEFYYKRQKVEKHSEEDINNATITVSGGYMTRNRLKKQLKNNDSEDIESKNKSIKAKRKRNRTCRASASTKKIQSGYIFSQDIYSTNLDKNLVMHAKCAPSLFESDSESEINNYQLETSITNEIKEKSISPEIELIHSAFNKSPAKIYFNKKLCLSNDKSNRTNTILNNVEETNEEEKIHVTESLIKQWKNELQIKNISTEGDSSLIHKLPSETNTVKSIVLNIEKEKGNNVHNSELLSAFFESKSRSHELSSETNTVKSVVLNKEEKNNKERDSEVYENSDMAANLSNEITELNNLLTFELENKNSEQTHTSIIDDVMCNNKVLSASSYNGSLLNHKEKVDDLDEFKLLPFNTTSIPTNNFSSIFDLPKNEAFMESCTDIKQDYFNESSIFDSKISNVISKEINQTNNFSTNELNNLVNQKNVCTLDDMIDDNMSCEKLSSSCSNDYLLEQDTDIYDLIKPKSPNIFENTLPRNFDLPKEKPNLNENFTCSETETFTDIPEEIIVPSNSQTETYCNDSLLVNSTDLIKSVESEKSPLKNIGTISINFMSIFDLPNKKTTVQMFADTVQNLNENFSLYSDSKMSELNDVKISTTDNNISDKLAKNPTTYSPNKIKKEKDNCPTLNKEISSNLITNQYVPTFYNHNKKRKSDTIISEIKNYDLIGNGNLQFEINNSSGITKNLQHDSQCLCKVFYCFNKDANQILTSKVKHFAFNTIAKKVCQKLHDLKKFEASLLKILINSDNKNIVQSKKFVPIFEPIPCNLKRQKCIESEKNDHIEPKILNILKDAYVGVDYLSSCDHYSKDGIELPNQQNVSNSNKLIVHSTRKKLTKSSRLITNNNEHILSNISNSYQAKFDVNFDKDKNNELHHNYLKHNTNVGLSNKSLNTSKVHELMANKDEQIDCVQSLISITNHHNKSNNILPDEIETRSEFSQVEKVPLVKNKLEQVTDKSLSHELSSEINTVKSIVLNMEEKGKEGPNFTFYDKCEKPLFNITDNFNEFKIVLPNEMETKSVFSSSEKVQFVNDKLDHETDSDSDFELKPLQNCQSNEPNILTIENNFSKECEESLNSKSMTNNYNKSKNILPDEIGTKSVLSPIEKVHFVKDKLDYVTVSDSDFELKPLKNCQSNEPNILTIENNFSEECDKTLNSISITNNYNKSKNILPDEIRTKSVLSSTEKVQFIKDKLDHVTDSDSDFELKPLPNCQSNEPNILTIENNFSKECEESLNSKSITNNYNKSKNILPDEIRTKSVLSPTEKVQFVKNKLDHVTDSDSDFELKPLPNCQSNEPNFLTIENNFSEECNKTLNSISLTNNYNKYKNILPDEIGTKSVLSSTEKVQFVNDKLDYVTDSDSDFELKPLQNCQSNEPNVLTIENSFSEECEKTLNSLSITNNYSKSKNILADEIGTKSVFSPLEKVQFVKDELEQVADSVFSHNFESSSKSLFDLSSYDVGNSYDYSSDDDCKLQINDEDNFYIDKSSTTVHSVFDNYKNSITTNSTATNELSDSIKLLNTKDSKSSTVISINQDHTVSKSSLLKKEKIFINNHDLAKEKEGFLESCLLMTVEMCNDYYEKRSMNKDASNDKYEHFPKHLKDIFKEMFVYEMYVPLCQHIIDLCDDNQLEGKAILFPTDDNNLNQTPEKIISGIKTENGVRLNIPINAKTAFQQENLNCYENRPNKNIIETNIFHSPQKSNDLKQSKKNKTEENKEMAMETETISHKPSETITDIQNSNSLQKGNAKSNMKVRLLLREMITSDNPFNTILESKEFRNLRFFGEEEIAYSIGVFIFEQTIESPVIIGLSDYRESYDHLNDEEKCKLLRSVKLNIVCPKITKLTSITLALAKMLRSDSLIELILNVIKKNVFTKKMATDHSVDHQLMKFTAYFVDICFRLRLLKILQMFIFDSMVLLPNKYCCVLFISLLLWKNCFPVRLNNEQDPVIITVLSLLIIKKKFYAEQAIGGSDIFQRELINLLSVHFNYSFTLDMPTNLIHQIHKPDFFVSVAMLLKCAYPKDLVEFIDICLFPIFEDYLNTQHNDTNAIRTMELINKAVKPFKVTCNITIATYLTKCKKLVEKKNNNNKEHIYNIMYISYKKLQNKFISYINDNRTRSQPFEESLVSIIMVLGSVDYLTSCMTLMKWKPKFQPSTILSEQFYMFKSILGHTVWDKLSAMDDASAVKSMINGYLLGKNEFNAFERIHALHWKSKSVT